MKRFKIIVIFLVLYSNISLSQEKVIVESFELQQIFSKFLGMPKFSRWSIGRINAIKVITEDNMNTYSVSITGINRDEALSADTYYYYLIDNTYFFLQEDDRIELKHSKHDSLLFNLSADEKRLFLYKLFRGEGAIISFPVLTLFKVHKKIPILNHRKVTYNTFHPIDQVPKKYWPISPRLYSDTQSIYGGFLDKQNNPNDEYRDLIKKGRFKITVPKTDNNRK
ncbi:MAG TPA: hypothetical protein PLJ84_02480 [Bacteroidales bacterium]|nr:hypothetical protein [Paludibacteraceae bacterium]HPT01435.1 hypothetical protein [Bacteroidales bacterium]